ncbi:MAG: rhomboid family intramembrane serine protease [Alphaproteobacteria bacterium]|nr:rhomboid family intramembrane serine protease [Alphaproteobacteria bacterium]
MLVLPIYDDNPATKPAFVTWGLIAACLLTYLWQAGLGQEAEQAAVLGFGMIPAVLTGNGELAPELYVIPGWATLFSSMFLHGGVMHLAGNMLFLWIFGNNVEDSMGGLRYLLFYLLCGVAAALGQTAAEPLSEVPMIGASGAISGVLGAYLLLYPKANVRVFLWVIVIVRILNIPAVIVLGLWFALQIYSGLSTAAGEAGVAFWAHAGGFVAGMALIPLFKHRNVPLFHGARSHAFSISRQAPPKKGPWG